MSSVANFVPAQADILRPSQTQAVFGVRKTLIGMSRSEGLRIRNAWVRGSNPLCGTSTYVSLAALCPVLYQEIQAFNFEFEA
jgi:hypothetical protein